MTKVEGQPLNFEFHQSAWQPVTIRGPVPVRGWIVGHAEIINSAEANYGYPNPPPGTMLVMLENESIREVFINMLEARDE